MKNLIIPKHLSAQLPLRVFAAASTRSWVGAGFVAEFAITWADVARGQTDTCVVNNAWPCKGLFFFSFFNKKGRQGETARMKMPQKLQRGPN